MFGATLAYTQLTLEPIETRTDAITENALPSIRQLAIARGALARLQNALQTSGSTNDPSVAEARHDLDASFAAYMALPDFPGERPISGSAESAIAVLEEHLDEARATPNSAVALEPLIRVAEGELFRLESFNIDHGLDEARQITKLKQHTRTVSLAFSVTSLLGAIAASLLLMRLLGKQAQLAVERETLLTTRATELEAFAGRIAHDLKSPLGTLALRLALMKQRDAASAERQEEHVDKAVRQVERIDHLIDGLLAFARAGANPPPGARAELRDVLDEVLDEVRPKAEAIHAELRVDPFPPREVACSPGALLSVLSNLLGNAIKYVVEGHAPVREIVVHVDDREKDVHVEIADTGPGLPAGAERNVFLPFVRAQSNQPGLGLGLATVKRIVEGFGGHVGVRSVLGQGSVFWFDIPKAEGAT